eukprot:c10017_g8_i1.p1 GENE.c10017_g8_i1~~c10017_g8_i1.p1  ORF type:complete len:133 (+),score=35.32 c10017_g8_i1:129-527(+)
MSQEILLLIVLGSLGSLNSNTSFLGPTMIGRTARASIKPPLVNEESPLQLPQKQSQEQSNQQQQQQEQHELVSWMLQQKINPSDAHEYTTKLIADGYESVESLSHLDDQEWEEYVTKKGHRKTLRSAILNQT